MFEILRLVRFRTIAFAAFTMYTVRYFVIKPMLDINNFTLQMADWAFVLLVISVCCLIAGAYVINDYFDTKTDRISGVKDVVVGRSVSRRVAISLHSILNLIAIGISFYLGAAIGIWKIGILFLLVSGILWFYSSIYKRFFITGNLIVAIMAALIPVSVLVYEIPLLNMAYADMLIKTNTNFMFMFSWIGGISWFIFLNILMYEINKDIYSVDGDKENGIQTFPVRLGIKAAKNIIIALIGVAIFSLGYIYFVTFSHSLLMLLYFIVALLMPYGIYMISIGRKNGNRLFQLRLIRIITVLCICTCFLLEHFFKALFASSSIPFE